MLDRYPKPKLTDALKEESKWKLAAAILLSLGFSFFIYQFFKLLKAVLFFMLFRPQFYDYPEFNLFSTVEDFVMASVMVVLGLNLAFEFLFNVPSIKRTSPGIRKRSRIVTDQVNIKWFLLFFLLSFFMIFIILYGQGVSEPFRYVEFPIAVAILLVLVLYFHSWESIRRYYRVKLQWVMLILLVNLIISFVFINIRTVDFKAVYAAYEKKYPLVKQGFELPVATDAIIYFRFYRDQLQNLYFFQENTGDLAPLLIYDEDQIEINEAGVRISSRQDKMPRWKAAISIPVINADANLDMKYINLLTEELRAHDFGTIAFAAKTTENEGDAFAARIGYLFYKPGRDKVPLHFINMQEFAAYLETENDTIVQY